MVRILAVSPIQPKIRFGREVEIMREVLAVVFVVSAIIVAVSTAVAAVAVAGILVSIFLF